MSTCIYPIFKKMGNARVCLPVAVWIAASNAKRKGQTCSIFYDMKNSPFAELVMSLSEK